MAWPMSQTKARVITSPFGVLKITATLTGVTGVGWPGAKDGVDEVTDAHPILDLTERQLAEYFAGQRRDFDLPLEMAGSDFQRRVWQRLLKIPYGQTASYGALARELGQPGAARAVGAANARNPLAIVVPCHRVIASAGSLSGFAGGVAMKRGLLALEGLGDRF